MNTIERIVVIVAIRSELQHLPGLPYLPTEPDDGNPWPSVSWNQNGMEIIAVACGIGMIRASAATEAMIAAHAPDAILNFGCTGAHERHVNVGDVVIGIRSVSHTSMVIAPDGSGRFDLHDGMEAPAAGQTGIASDPALLAIVRVAANGWTPERWIGAANESPAPCVHEGVVASADVWTQAHDAIARLAQRHLSLCEDMESAAIATVAALHGVPYLTIKDISNNELQQATIFDPALEHLPEREVGRRAAMLTGRVIDRLASVQEGTSSG
ncbi:MAG: 5'-methylthioadenosine/S-adenosylhomocysteine nucleosidase [Chloroflexota bacterium]|nr:5'-methylthioadenosine/S-adenosylhomocysteine nucleosidase [Chloroflexota bacterium]